MFDALYPSLHPDNFQAPLRRLGLGFIARLPEALLGKSGVSYQGNILVEGTWYCAEMPSELVNASKARTANQIADGEYIKRLERRKAYESYPINGSRLIGQDGELVSRRYECAASRRVNPVGCTRKPGSPPPGVMLLPVRAAAPDAVLPKACANKTFQIPAHLGLRHEQAFPYQGPEWRSYNNRFRSANEGKNGSAKNPARQAIGTAGRRRVRGLAANGIITAVQLAAENLTSVKRFIQAAEPDCDGIATRTYPQYRGARNATRSNGKTPNRRRSAPKTSLRRAPSVGRATSARTSNMRT